MRRLYISNNDESPRVFENNILDYLSRTSWYLPLVFWIPILSILFYYSYSNYAISFEVGLGCLIVAFIFWTFMEYILHRFVFHFEPSSELGKRIHFLAHGVHHDFPNDSKRLVLPPTMSLLLSSIFFLTFYLFLGKFYILFYIGFMLGYLFYDTCHYALHHAKWENPYFKKLKEQHMLHHYHNPESGYGVTTEIWDKVFGTPIKK